MLKKVPLLKREGFRVSYFLYDFGCPPSLWDGYKDSFADCTYVLFEDSGHNPMYEIPEKFDKLVIDWIKTH